MLYKLKPAASDFMYVKTQSQVIFVVRKYLYWNVIKMLS